MDLQKIIKMQREFDELHGWVPDNTLESKIDMINKDIIGLIGEVGEFSNIIKKINLQIDRNDMKEAESFYQMKYDQLSEELVDIFIYLLRISSHLDADIVNAYLEKLQYNKDRYKIYECRK